MSEPEKHHLVSRKPVPTGSSSSHQIARSHSTLWRPWSPKLASTSDYERSIHKFPWLANELEYSNDYEDIEGGYSPLPQFSSDPGSGTKPIHAAAEDSVGPTNIKNAPDERAGSNLVSWSGPADQENPRNWPKHKKWTATLLVSCFTFISPLSSTMLAPALPTLANEFNVTSPIETYLLMSIFLLAYAVGPFVLAPLSEMYGRVVMLQSANLVFLLFNTVCGWSSTKKQMLAFRFLSGLGGSAPQALGGGVLSDCWSAEERGMASAIYSLAPFLGPAVGPIAAGYLTQYLNWRWIFWTVSIADALVQVLVFLFLQETYAPRILAVKAKRMRKASKSAKFCTEYEGGDRTFGQTLRKALFRPFIMLFTQPALQVTALYRAYLYGLMYLVLATFPMVWADQYGQEPGPASLNYISLGVGFIIGLQVSGPLIDQVYKMLQKRYNHPGRPEFRIPLMYLTAIVTPVGLVVYGLAAHFRTHWIVPNVGAGIFAAGLILSFQCVQTYTIDTYERYAASATGAAAFVRTMAGFSFPLFAPRLYDALGILGGNGVLAGVAFLLGIIVPTLMWKYGVRLRRRSLYFAE